MRFGDVARWSLSRMGFVVSERMKPFLRRLLKHHRFEEMRIPLGVVATDLCTGEPVSFRDTGDVCLPIRASCSYPGLFQPVRAGGRVLVDGAMSTEIPALLARELGATHVVSVHLPAPSCQQPPTDVFQVVRRCFQIMQIRNEDGWRQASDLVITPDLQAIEWDAFERGPELVNAGEAAALAALPAIQSWFSQGTVSVFRRKGRRLFATFSRCLRLTRARLASHTRTLIRSCGTAVELATVFWQPREKRLRGLRPNRSRHVTGGLFSGGTKQSVPYLFADFRFWPRRCCI